AYLRAREEVAGAGCARLCSIDPQRLLFPETASQLWPLPRRQPCVRRVWRTRSDLESNLLSRHHVNQRGAFRLKPPECPGCPRVGLSALEARYSCPDGRE